MQTRRYMQSEHMKGIVCIILAAFFFSLMSVFVKLSGDVPTMQKSLFRNLIAAVIAFVTLAGTPEKISIRRDCIGGLLLRSLFGFLIFGAVPDLFSVIGYVIIITAAVIRWHWSRRAA